MAIELEFINIIIPIEKINRLYPGGFNKFLKDKNIEKNPHGKYWYDDHLFRDGAMNPNDAGYITKELEKLGFKAKDEQTKEWKDFAVISSFFISKKTNCKWLRYNSENGTVEYKNLDNE